MFELRSKNQSKMESSIELMDGSGSTVDDDQEFGVGGDSNVPHKAPSTSGTSTLLNGQQQSTTASANTSSSATTTGGSSSIGLAERTASSSSGGGGGSGDATTSPVLA